MDTVVSVEDDDEEEEEEAKQTSTQHHGRVHCSLGTLCDWYSCQTKVRRRSTACVRAISSIKGVTVTMDAFSNYRNPAAAHLEKSAALLVGMVTSSRRL